MTTVPPSPRPDPYEVLGVARDVGAEELRLAWRRLMLLHHPDRAAPGARAAAAARAARIDEAYRTLADPARRARADRSAPAQPAGPGFALPPVVGSTHLGLGRLRALGVAVAAGLGALVAGGVLGSGALVGAGALALPCAGVWFVVAELGVADRA